MDEDKKARMKYELVGIQTHLSMVDSYIGMVSAAASTPVMVAPTLPPIVIQAFDRVAKAMQEQRNVTDKLLKFVETMLDEIV